MKYNAFISYSHAEDHRRAPAVHSALHRFARPWYRLRALHVFRDKESLAATPELWGTIERALQSAEYFVLLASPRAAKSPWVQKEIQFWLDNKSAKTFLIVVTGGGIAWDDSCADFDWNQTTALPRFLGGAFQQEPLYVDLSWASKDQHFSLRDGRFYEAIKVLAAGIHGRPPDEMAGEDHRQHRRTKLIAAAAVSAIVAFGVSAEFQRRIAVEERDNATAFLSQLQVNNALDRVDAGDTLGALPWLAEVIKRDYRNEARLNMHRVRFGMYGRGVPRLLQSWAHDLPCTHAEFSPDGSRIVTAHGISYPREESRGEARVWDALGGQPVSPPLRHQGSVYWAAFSPDGTKIATASGDKTARIWDARTGRPVSEPLSHPGLVRQAVWSVDGHKLATATSRGAQVWDGTSGAPLTPLLEIPGRNAWHVAFDPAGERVLVTYGSSYLEGAGSARLWSAATGEPLTPIIERSDKWVSHGAFSPDGKRFVIADAGGEAQVFDSESGQPLGAPIQHKGRVAFASFSPDGGVLLTGGWDGTVHLRNLTTSAEQILSPEGQARHLTFSPDGGLIATASTTGFARVWEVETGEPVTPALRFSHSPYPGMNLFEPGETPGPEYSVNFAPDGHRLLTAGWDGTVRIWDLSTAAEKSISIPEESPPFGYQFTAPVSRLAVKKKPESVEIVDTETGEQITLPVPSDAHMVKAVYGPDRQWLAVWEDSIVRRGWLRLVNMQTRQVRTLDLQHPGTINDVFSSPDGSRLGVVLGSDFFLRGHSLQDADISDVTPGQIRIWDVASGQPVAPPFEASDWVGKALFGPAGNQVVGYREGRLQLWNVDTGKPVTAMMKHSKDINVIEFSPKGDRIATASQDWTARVWDAATGEPLTPALRHAGEDRLGPNGVTAIAFGADGTILVTGDAAGGCRLWDAFTGSKLGPLLRHDSAVVDIDMDSGGKELFVKGISRSLRTWDLSPVVGRADDLLAIAQALSTRALDATGNLVEISSRDVAQKLAQAKGSNLAFLAPSEQQVLLWHYSRFARSQAARQSYSALFHLNRILEFRPGEAGGYAQRAAVYAKNGDFDRAIEDYSRALQLDATTPRIRLARGNAWIQLQRWSEALADYRRAIELGDTSDTTVLLNALLVLVTDDQTDIPVVARQLAERAGPADRGTLMAARNLRGLAVALYAADTCERLLSSVEPTLDENQPAMLPGAADRYCSGDYASVVDSLRQEVERNSGHYPALQAFMLAISSYRMGDFVAADHWLKQGKDWRAALEGEGFTKYDRDLATLAQLHPTIQLAPALELLVLERKAEKLMATR